MPHTKRYKKYQLGGSDIYDLSSEFCRTTRKNIHIFFAQPPGETSHDYTLCFSTAAAAARLPRRFRGARGRTALREALHEGYAAVVEQLISAGATVDTVNNSGRGPGRVFGSFWEWL